MIAFVRYVSVSGLVSSIMLTLSFRLDSRQAAEEVVERLHGRVVRGWNDNGCRIAVRFADTSEQRELRVRYLL